MAGETNGKNPSGAMVPASFFAVRAETTAPPHRESEQDHVTPENDHQYTLEEGYELFREGFEEVLTRLGDIDSLSKYLDEESMTQIRATIASIKKLLDDTEHNEKNCYTLKTEVADLEGFAEQIEEEKRQETEDILRALKARMIDISAKAEPLLRSSILTEADVAFLSKAIMDAEKAATKADENSENLLDYLADVTALERQVTANRTFVQNEIQKRCRTLHDTATELKNTCNELKHNESIAASQIRNIEQEIENLEDQIRLTQNDPDEDSYHFAQTRADTLVQKVLEIDKGLFGAEVLEPTRPLLHLEHSEAPEVVDLHPDDIRIVSPEEQAERILIVAEGYKEGIARLQGQIDLFRNNTALDQASVQTFAATVAQLGATYTAVLTNPTHEDFEEFRALADDARQQEADLLALTPGTPSPKIHTSPALTQPDENLKELAINPPAATDTDFAIKTIQIQDNGELLVLSQTTFTYVPLRQNDGEAVSFIVKLLEELSIKENLSREVLDKKNAIINLAQAQDFPAAYEAATILDNDLAVEENNNRSELRAFANNPPKATNDQFTIPTIKEERGTLLVLSQRTGGFVPLKGKDVEAVQEVLRALETLKGEGVLAPRTMRTKNEIIDLVTAQDFEGAQELVTTFFATREQELAQSLRSQNIDALYRIPGTTLRRDGLYDFQNPATGLPEILTDSASDIVFNIQEMLSESEKVTDKSPEFIAAKNELIRLCLAHNFEEAESKAAAFEAKFLPSVAVAAPDNTEPSDDLPAGVTADTSGLMHDIGKVLTPEGFAVAGTTPDAANDGATGSVAGVAPDVSAAIPDVTTAAGATIPPGVAGVEPDAPTTPNPLSGITASPSADPTSTVTGDGALGTGATVSTTPDGEPVQPSPENTVLLQETEKARAHFDAYTLYCAETGQNVPGRVTRAKKYMEDCASALSSHPELHNIIISKRTDPDTNEDVYYVQDSSDASGYRLATQEETDWAKAVENLNEEIATYERRHTDSFRPKNIKMTKDGAFRNKKEKLDQQAVDIVRSILWSKEVKFFTKHMKIEREATTSARLISLRNDIVLHIEKGEYKEAEVLFRTFRAEVDERKNELRAHNLATLETERAKPVLDTDFDFNHNLIQEFSFSPDSGTYEGGAYFIIEKSGDFSMMHSEPSIRNPGQKSQADNLDSAMFAVELVKDLGDLRRASLDRKNEILRLVNNYKFQAAADLAMSYIETVPGTVEYENVTKIKMRSTLGREATDDEFNERAHSDNVAFLATIQSTIEEEKSAASAASASSTSAAATPAAATAVPGASTGTEPDPVATADPLPSASIDGDAPSTLGVSSTPLGATTLPATAPDASTGSTPDPVTIPETNPDPSTGGDATSAPGVSGTSSDVAAAPGVAPIPVVAPDPTTVAAPDASSSSTGTATAPGAAPGVTPTTVVTSAPDPATVTTSVPDPATPVKADLGGVVPPGGPSPDAPDPEAPATPENLKQPKLVQDITKVREVIKDGQVQYTATGDDGKQKILPNDKQEWSTLFRLFRGTKGMPAGVKPLYTRTLAFFETGNVAEKRKKRELYNGVLEIQNELVEEAHNLKPWAAINKCDLLEEALDNAEANWKIEQSKVERDEEGRKRRAQEEEDRAGRYADLLDNFGRLKRRAERAVDLVTSDIEKDYLRNAIKEVEKLFNESEIISGQRLEAIARAISALADEVSPIERGAGTLKIMDTRFSERATSRFGGREELEVKPETTNRPPLSDSRQELLQKREEALRADIRTRYIAQAKRDPRKFIETYRNKADFVYGKIEKDELQKVMYDAFESLSDADKFAVGNANIVSRGRFGVGSAEARNNPPSIKNNIQGYSPALATPNQPKSGMINPARANATPMAKSPAPATRIDPTFDAPRTSPQATPERSPASPEKRLGAASRLLATLESSRGKKWLMYALPIAVISTAALWPKSDAPSGQPSTDTTASAPSNSNLSTWRSYIQAPDKIKMLQDIETLSNNDLLNKYVPNIVSENPSEISKLLKVEGFDFMHNKNPNAYSYSQIQKEKLSKFLELVADTHRYINATDNAEALTSPGPDRTQVFFTPKTYGDIPPKVTLGDYLDSIRKNFALADAKDAKRTKTT